MPNLKDIRTRIASVKNTQKITSAMKMVSAAKLRRAQERAEQARPYALKMDLVISSVAGRVQDATHPLLQVNELPSKALVIVVTSNRGLCAGFNANVFRTLARFLREQAAAGVEVHLATVGRKGDVFYRTRDTKVARNYTDVIGNISYAKAKKIAQDAIENFVAGEYDRVYIIYNEFVSAIAYNTNIHQLLPLSLDDLAAAPAADLAASEYIFEPDEDSLLERLLPANIEVQVLRALLEAEASEHAARMSAMDSATTNAKEMISALTLQYNRARQAYITKELVEIVSGAEALKG
ncbi:MAG: ATP synthase F1 subunit gamma [bacterium]